MRLYFKTKLKQIWARLEQLTMSYPFKLFSSADPLLGRCALNVLQDFLNEDGCCLDEWFSEPLRIACPTLERLRKLDIRELLAQISRKCPSTNMSLEGLLALIKSSWRGGHHKPFVETAGHLGMLTQLLQAHMKSGGKNPFQDHRADLLASGVPLAQTHREAKASRGGSKQRLDVAWRNTLVHQWKLEHKDASDDTVTHQHWVFAQQRRGMSEDQKTAALAAAGVGQSVADAARRIQLLLMGQSPADDEVGLPDTAVALPPSSEWQCGTCDWPVHPKLLQEFFAGKYGGLCGQARQARWAARSQVLIADAGAIPADRTFPHRYSCGERHPGLCFTKDDEFYRECLEVASAMEQFV